MRSFDLPIVTLAAMLALATSVHAESPPAGTGPCASAIARFCKSVPPGEGRLRACLMAHESEVPAECRLRMGSGGSPKPSGKQEPAMGPRSIAACRGDIAKHCAGVPSGGGRWRACLEAHASDVTAACKVALSGGPSAASPARRAP